jgi:hypothetical protein
MPDRSRKRPKDPNQLAKRVVDAATRDDADVSQPQKKNPAAVALGRLGGLKGGKARAAKLSAEEKKEVARHAAKVRWSNRPRDDD